MAGQKRARQVARDKHARQHERRTSQAERQRRNGLIAVGVVVTIIAVVLAFVFWPESSEQTAEEQLANTEVSAPPAPVPTPSDVSCTEANGTPNDKTYTKAPQQGLKPGAALVLDTNCGKIDIALETNSAPVTSNAIAFLATDGWYNGNTCSRLTTQGIFVVQCGASNPDGLGDSGLAVPREALPTPDPSTGAALYPAGSVAIAASAQGPSGSQFFIVYKDTALGAEYNMFGKVTSGLNVVEYIAANGVADGSQNPADGPPAQPLVINTATVRNGS
ncbi:MAG: peptidylprolyl isomerase [Actinobacteria bacterium]|nr:peptidylprolyl isomerase [Actinomycetota bacterium]